MYHDLDDMLSHIIFNQNLLYRVNRNAFEIKMHVDLMTVRLHSRSVELIKLTQSDTYVYRASSPKLFLSVSCT